ncbi:centromere-associated protein E-like [Eriocheir sinensis]|uniref:centromere-associated protein E-like n=1 Tax=Eriocheir sinensis TaxID=95602 RepID=UPI0021C7A539|nr:centromere-associated protein E-like [Eriocheir sinensis]
MSDNILVTVRVRPFIKREEADGGNSSPTSHWELQDSCSLVQVDPISRRPLCAPYMCDGVFGPEERSEDVYQEVAMPIVESALSGFNGTIFVYGQTASGKTYTMMGDRNSPGIIPLAIQNIYRSIEDTPDREYLIRASYMEIYNENISDLLAGRDPKNRSLTIREDQSGLVYVADLKEECANCEKNLLMLMKRGEKNRSIGSTNMNERSSRSHTIFRIIIESRERSQEDGEEGAITVSHLNLVDLAGSENASQSGATGERLKEGGFINKSLFMLGRVISQLSEGEPFVNFRDSKLTRILQLSLGGNAKTAIICTITPAVVDQTHSTLRFACRAKSIKNKPIVNEILSEAALLKRYAKEIKALQNTLATERNSDKAQEVEQVREMLGEQARRNEELEAKIHELKTKLVVSSLPCRSPRRSLDKKRKARRETWCAPAMRSRRPSIGLGLLPTIIQDHQFIKPMLPPWAEESPSANASLNTSAINMETTLSMEEFGTDDISFILNQAEKTKVKEGDSLQISPAFLNVRQRKRVKFDIASPTSLTKEASCQTSESLAPQMRLPPSVLPDTPQGTPTATPTRPSGTPGTPASVLRARNLDMKEKLREKEEWLNNWRQELESQKEFQRQEIRALEESFEGRLANAAATAAATGSGGGDGDEKETTHAEENESLKRSLRDYEQLLMDANRELSHNVQNSAELQMRVEALSEENIQLSALQEEIVRQREENNTLRKDAEARECRLKELEYERQDFDMMMELALKKQKQREEDLRRILDDAWKEIAALEKGDVEEVRKRSQRLFELEEMAKQTSTKAEEGNNEEKIAALQESLEEMQQEASRLREELLQATHEKHQLDQEVKDLQDHFSHVQSEYGDDKIKILEEASQEKEQLKQEVKDLQEHLSQVLSESGEDRIKMLKEEIVELEARLEEAEQRQEVEKEEDGVQGIEMDTQTLPASFMHVASSRKSSGESGETNALTSQDFSRVLSETLQALEESVCIPPTPGRRSITSSIDALSFQDLEMAKPMVETLKSGLMALQEYIQVMEQQQQEAAQTTHYHLQAIAKAEEEMGTWRAQESFIGDYILHSAHPWKMEHHHHPLQQQNHQDHHLFSNSSLSQQHHSPPSPETHTSTQPSSPSQQHQSPPSSTDSHSSTQLSIPSSSPGSFLRLPTTQTTMEEAVQRAVEEERKRLVNEYEAKLKEVVAVRAHKRHSSAATDTLFLSFTRNDISMNAGPGEGSRDATQEASFFSVISPNIENLEKSDLETEVLRLSEELSRRNITEEEMHCYRWQVDTLKEEKSSMEEEVRFLQDEVEKLTQKEKTSMESPVKGQVELMDCTDMKQGESFTTYSADPENKSSRDEDELQQRASDLQEANKKIELLLLEIEKIREASPSDSGNSDKERSDDKGELHQKTKELEEAKEKIEFLELEIKKIQGAPPADQGNHENRELQQKTKELEEAKEKIEFLELEIKKIQRAPPADQGNHENRELQQKTMELEEAKEKIEFLELEIKKIQRAPPADQGNHENRELQQKTKELEEAMEKIKLLELEMEKTQEELTNMVVEKDTDLEMIIANFTDKEEAFEQTERELRRVTTEIEELKETLATKDQELGRFRDQQHEELDRATAQLEEMKETLANKSSELEKVTLKLQEMEEALTNKDLDVQSLDKQQEELHRATVELEEVKETLSNKDLELEEMKATLANKNLELQALRDKHPSLQEEMDQLVNHEALATLEEKLQNLQQEYAELEVQSENKVLEAQKKAKDFEEKYEGCFQDYAAASRVCEENRHMFQKSEEEKEELRLKHLEEKNVLNLKYKEEVQKAEDEMEKLILKYEDDLQKSEEEKESLKLQNENAIQKYKEKDDLKQKCECELRQGSAPREPEPKEALDLYVGGAMVGQRLDEIEALKDQLEERVKECAQLKDTVDNLKTVLARRQEEAQRVSEEHQEELTFYMDSLKEKDKNLKNLENEVQRRSDEVASLTSTLSAKDQHLQRLEKNLLVTEQNLKDKEAELEALFATYSETSKKVQDLQEDLDSLRKDYEEVCADKRRMNEALEKLKDKNVELQKLSHTQTETSQRVEELQESMDRLQEDYAKVCAERESISEALEKLKDKNMELQNLHHTQTNTSQRVEELQESMDRLQQDYEEVCADRKSINETLEKLKDKNMELQKLSHTQTETSKRVEELQESMDKLQQDYAEVCAERESMSEALEKLKDKEVELQKVYHTQMEDSKKVEELQEDFASLRKEYHEVCADRRSVSQALEELKGKEVELQKLYSTQKEASMRVQENLDTLKKEYMEVCASKNEALEKLKDKEVELQNFSSTQIESSKRVEELEEAMARLQKDYEEVCADRRNMNKTHEALKEDKETLSHKFTSQCAQLDIMEEDILQLKDELEMQQNEIAQLKEVIMNLQADKERLEEEHLAQKAKEVELLDQQVTVSQEMEKLIEEIEKYECEMTKKEQQVLALTEELESTTNRLAEMEKLTEILQSATDSLEEKCRQREMAERTCEVLQQEMKEVENLKAEARRAEELMVQLSAAEDKISFLKERCVALEEAHDSRKYGVNTEEHEGYGDINTLVNKLQQVERENKTLRKTLEEQQQTGNQKTETANMVDLQHRINELENELKVYKQKHTTTTTTADNSNSAARPACGDCTNYKAMVGKLNDLVREKEREYERKEDELMTRLNMTLNANDSLANVSMRDSRRSRVAKLEEEKEGLQMKMMRNFRKVRDLEAALETLRRTNGVISQDPEMRRELRWMWEKMEDAERKLEILNKNYDLLERENEELKELVDQQTEDKTQAGGTIVLQVKAELKALQERYRALESKYSSLQEQHSDLQGKAKLTVGSGISQEQHDVLQRDHNKLQEDYDVLEAEHRTLKESCRSLTEEQSTLQRDLGSLQERYSTLQETHHTLLETHSALKNNYASLEETHTVLQETHKTLEEKYSYARDRFNALREKYNNLTELYNTSLTAKELEEQNSSTSRMERDNASVNITPAAGVMVTPLGMAGVQEGVVEDLKEQLAASLRENNELKFRLRALDAPSQKIADSLREELRIANVKVTHLKDELRRLQNSGHPDATICELTGQSSAATSSSQQDAKEEYNYSTGSGVVAQLQVVEMQGKMYHLEKSKKKVDEQLKLMEQHMEHYRGKAQEWKEKAIRGEKAGHRVKEELNQLKAELRQQRAKTDELNTQIERQQFELGHQRETIVRLEKERKEGVHCTPSSASAAAITSSSATPAVPFPPEVKPGTDIPASQESAVTLAGGSRGLAGRVGGVSTAGIGRGRTTTSLSVAEGGGGEFKTPAPVTTRAGGRGITTTGIGAKEETVEKEDKDKEQQQQERLQSKLLGLHNAPLPTLTRTERLPWVKGGEVDAGAAPLWQTLKENKDVSKYKLPPEERRKIDENCKTQ